MEAILFSVGTCRVLLWILLSVTGVEVIISTYFWAVLNTLISGYLICWLSNKVFMKRVNIFMFVS